jgi:hypothetical protein|tara:strand:- start:33 stop:434 length:402 start_codon:yes stop_codon:yes gene_type:complete
MALVHDSVRKCLIDALPTISGLQAIYVTTQDGIELATAISDDMDNMKKEHLGTVFAFAADRGSKLGLGNVQSAVCTFEDGLYVHVSFSPIIVTFVGETTMKSSDVENIIPLFKKLLEPVRGAVSTIDDDEEED